MNFFKKTLLFLIRFYQKAISLDSGLPHLIWPHLRICRYNPTCSEYTYQAILKYGIISGVLLGLKRILRCHPGSKGGNDPLI